MKATVEREVKLAPCDGFVLPELGEPLPLRRFTSTYHDTPDLVLARHGVTLRHRVERGTGVWQLKLPQGAARNELEQPGPPARPPLELTALVVALLRGRELAPVARLRTRREGVRADGADVVHDVVSVLDGQRVIRRFRELEIELVNGSEKQLRQLEKQLRKAGATPANELRPKLHRALELDVPVPVAATRDTPPAAALALALGEQARRLLLHDPGVRLGSDPEELHELRVATRRLRAFLRAGRELLAPSWSEPLRDELGWLGGALGPARDLDVLTARLEADVDTLGVAAAGLLEDLTDERTNARAVVVGTLSSDRYLALLDRLEHVADPEPSGTEPSLHDVWRAEWTRTRKAFARLDKTSPDTELHAARIRVKRSRYAAELAAHELGKRGRMFVRSAKELQDVLGEHQDASVAEERIQAWAAGAADAGAAASILELERRRKTAARAAWKPAWKELRDAAIELA